VGCALGQLSLLRQRQQYYVDPASCAQVPAHSQAYPGISLYVIWAGGSGTGLNCTGEYDCWLNRQDCVVIRALRQWVELAHAGCPVLSEKVSSNLRLAVVLWPFSHHP